MGTVIATNAALWLNSNNGGQNEVNMDSIGSLIVIESVDNDLSKQAVTDLAKRLKASGRSVVEFDFPQYDQPSSYFVTQFEAEAYGPKEQVGPYTESLFYALDQFQAATEINQALTQGKVVLARRYTSSVMAEQGQLFASNEERRGFFIWFDNLASVMFKIPRPNQTLILHPSNPSGSQANLTNVYNELCQMFPRDFKSIDTTRSGKPLPAKTINDLLWETILPLVPAESTELPASTDNQASLPAYKIPDKFDRLTQELYTAGIEAILTKQSELATKLAEYSDQQPYKDQLATARQAAELALPIACRPEFTIPQIQTEAAISTNYGQQVESLRLSQVSPRNELDLLPEAVYQNEHLSLAELADEVNKLPYAKKANLFINAIAPGQSGAESILGSLNYTWDILDSFQTIAAWQATDHKTSLIHQALTPRYGYDMPDIVDQAGLSELFEDCFDLSLQLHSKLVAAGFETEAQLATLAGHKVRYLLNQTAGQLTDFINLEPGDDLSALRPYQTSLAEKLVQTHPLIAEALQKPNKNV